MLQKKAITHHTFALIYLFLFTAFFLHHITVPKSELQLDLSFSAKPTKCDYADITYASNKLENGTNVKTNVRYYYTDFSKISTYIVSIPFEAQSFEYYPCDVSQNVYISSVKVSHKDRVKDIPFWNFCSHCPAEHQGNGVYLVKPPDNTRVRFDVSLDKVHEEFDTTSVQEKQKRRALEELILIAGLLIPLLLLMLKKRALFFCMIVCLYAVIIKYTFEHADDIIALLPLTKISKNKIVGYVHYSGYPIQSDYVIIGIVILTPAILCMLLFTLQWFYRKHFSKKNES